VKETPVYCFYQHFQPELPKSFFGVRIKGQALYFGDAEICNKTSGEILFNAEKIRVGSLAKGVNTTNLTCNKNNSNVEFISGIKDIDGMFMMQARKHSPMVVFCGYSETLFSTCAIGYRNMSYEFYDCGDGCDDCALNEEGNDMICQECQDGYRWSAKENTCERITTRDVNGTIRQIRSASVEWQSSASYLQVGSLIGVVLAFILS